MSLPPLRTPVVASSSNRKSGGGSSSTTAGNRSPSSSIKSSTNGSGTRSPTFTATGLANGHSHSVTAAIAASVVPKKTTKTKSGTSSGSNSSSSDVRVIEEKKEHKKKKLGSPSTSISSTLSPLTAVKASTVLPPLVVTPSRTTKNVIDSHFSASLAALGRPVATTATKKNKNGLNRPSVYSDDDDDHDGAIISRADLSGGATTNGGSYSGFPMTEDTHERVALNEAVKNATPQLAVENIVKHPLVDEVSNNYSIILSYLIREQDSVVLEEEWDEHFEPKDSEVDEYAAFIGMDPAHDHDLWWIAREGLKVPLPQPWKPCEQGGDVYYFNFETGESVWTHPCDEYSKKLFASEKARQLAEKERKEELLIDESRPAMLRGASLTKTNTIVHGLDGNDAKSASSASWLVTRPISSNGDDSTIVKWAREPTNPLW